MKYYGIFDALRVASILHSPGAAQRKLQDGAATIADHPGHLVLFQTHRLLIPEPRFYDLPFDKLLVILALLCLQPV